MEFLGKHRIGVVTTLLKDKTPHSAAIHYANSENGEIYMMTGVTSKKCQALLEGEVGPASFVTGFSDEEWVSLQMDGEINTVTDKDELSQVHAIYFAKNPGPEKYKDDPDTVFLKFTPKWYRYTEFKPKHKEISSESEV